MRPHHALLILFALQGSPPDARAAELAPDALVRRALEHLLFRSRGVEMTMRMELRSKAGELRTRTLHSRSLRTGGLGRSLVRFLSPSDVAGTAFLFVERQGGESEQHMYLPALKVVKRIVGEQRRSSFMGSDFTYTDLDWTDLEGAACRRAGVEPVGQHPCDVVDCTPRRQETYQRLRVFIRRKDGVPLRVQFFGREAEPLKVLFIKELKPVAGKLTATHLRMVTRQSGHATEIRIDDIRVRDDLSPDAFTPQALRQR